MPAHRPNRKPIAAAPNMATGGHSDPPGGKARRKPKTAARAHAPSAARNAAHRRRLMAGILAVVPLGIRADDIEILIKLDALPEACRDINNSTRPIIIAAVQKHWRQAMT